MWGDDASESDDGRPFNFGAAAATPAQGGVGVAFDVAVADGDQRNADASRPEAPVLRPWVRYYDAKGDAYYHNPNTGVTSWDLPKQTPSATASATRSERKGAKKRAATPLTATATAAAATVVGTGTRKSGGLADYCHGYCFLCDNRTMGEVFERQLYGLPENKLGELASIANTTPIFLLNFRTRIVYGVFAKSGSPAMNIEPDAWAPKSFPAQLRWEHSAHCNGSANAKRLSWKLTGGALDRTQVDELSYLLGATPTDVYLDPDPEGGVAGQQQAGEEGAAVPGEQAKEEEAAVAHVHDEDTALLKAATSPAELRTLLRAAHARLDVGQFNVALAAVMRMPPSEDIEGEDGANGGGIKGAMAFLREAEDLVYGAVAPDMNSYIMVIACCGKLGEYHRAVELLDAYEATRLMGMGSKCALYEATIVACRNSGEAGAAMSLFQKIQSSNACTDGMKYVAAMAKCESDGQSQEGLQLLDEMRERGLAITPTAYSIGISLAEQGAAYELGLDMHREARVRGLALDTIAIAKAITCSHSGGQWEQTVQLLDGLHAHESVPPSATYAAAVEMAIDTLPSLQIETAREIVAQAIANGLYRWVFNADSNINELNLTEQRVGEQRGAVEADACNDAVAAAPTRTLQPSLARALLYHTLLEYAEGERAIADLTVIDGFDDDEQERKQGDREGQGQGQGRGQGQREIRHNADRPISPLEQARRLYKGWSGPSTSAARALCVDEAVPPLEVSFPFRKGNDSEEEGGLRVGRNRRGCFVIPASSIEEWCRMGAALRQGGVYPLSMRMS